LAKASTNPFCSGADLKQPQMSQPSEDLTMKTSERERRLEIDEEIKMGQLRTRNRRKRRRDWESNS